MKVYIVVSSSGPDLSWYRYVDKVCGTEEKANQRIAELKKTCFHDFEVEEYEVE